MCVVEEGGGMVDGVLEVEWVKWIGEGGLQCECTLTAMLPIAGHESLVSRRVHTPQVQRQGQLLQQ